MPKRNLWLCIPPVATVLFDNAMTLWHQPAAYWQGAYWTALEAAPHGLWLLKKSPFVFETFMLGYILFLCFMIAYLPRIGAMFVSTVIVLGHLNGATTWIALDRPLDGYWINLFLCIIASVLLVASYYLTLPPPKVTEEVSYETPEAVLRLSDRFSQN